MSVIQSTVPVRAQTMKRFFSRETSVEAEIFASPKIIWALLTDAENYTKWNSTVISMEGNIAPKEKIKLVSTLAPKRAFRLTVKEFVNEQKLTWGDAMGSRVYTLKDTGRGSTILTVREKIGGPIFPLFASLIPSFDESFEKFIADIKNASESSSNA